MAVADGSGVEPDANGVECVFRICHFPRSGHYEKNNNKDVPRR